MELDSRQRWELVLVVLLSAMVTVAAVWTGQFDLVSGTRAAALYDMHYAQIQTRVSDEHRIEGEWEVTRRGLSLQPGQSGTVTIRLQNDHEARLVAFLYGGGGPGFHPLVSVSDDGHTFREVARDISVDGGRIDLTPAVGQPETVWLKLWVVVEPGDTLAEPTVLSRVRVVVLEPPLRLPNLPIASLLILTPVLAYVTRTLIRPTRALAYGLAVLCGLAILAAALAGERMAGGPHQWWEVIMASQEGGLYLLAPYVTLLGLLGWQVRMGRATSSQQEIWSWFALGGVLAMAGNSRLGALVEVVTATPGGDALQYMQLADLMDSPYETGPREPFWIWMVKGWFWLTGNSGLHLRLLTVVLSLLLLLVAYKLFRDYTGRPLVGILVAGLLGANPYFISLSVRGLREEAYLLAILCLVYVVLVPNVRWSLRGQAIGLAVSGAAVQLLRFNSYVFVIPLLLFWAWKQGHRKWMAVALPLAFITAVSVPHLAHNYRHFGDPMYSVNMHFDYAWYYEFVALKDSACDGCPSVGELMKTCCGEQRLGAYEYVFGFHSVREVVSNTFGGYLDLYLRPTDLFRIQSSTQSASGYAFYLLGLGLVLFGPHREILAVIVLLANGVPFAMALGLDPRLGVQTAPFVTFVVAYALWWSFERTVYLWNLPGMPVAALWNGKWDTLRRQYQRMLVENRSKR